MIKRAKMLYKDKDNAWLGGICAGFADKFGFNVIGVRLIFIILSLFTNFIMVLIYLILVVTLKEKPILAGNHANPPKNLNDKAKLLLPKVEKNLKKAEQRLSQMENYIISERFSFQRQLHQKD